MTWIPDEYQQAFVTAGPYVRAIGWLSDQHPFPTGAVPEEFRHKLRDFVVHAQQGNCEVAYGFGYCMGFHTCELCPPARMEGQRLVGVHGLRNLAVPYANLLCIFPEMVSHYVDVHGYRPPQAFVDAVLDSPLPDEVAYGAQAEQFLTSKRAGWAHRSAADHAWATNWYEKGMCPHCEKWQYLARLDGDARHCDAPLVNRQRNPQWRQPPVTRLVIIGPAGAGKTTVADRVAERLTLWSLEGDDLHSLANVAKMRHGVSLDDADRAPWLKALHAVMVERASQGRSFVVTCSALKAAYREQLARGVDGLRFVYLRADRDLLAARLAARPAHFFSPALLDSQLAALQEPSDALVIDAARPVEAIVAQIVAAGG